MSIPSTTPHLQPPPLATPQNHTPQSIPKAMTSQTNPSSKFPFANLDIRQHMLEDGTIIDFPADVLRHPPPKPMEFVYLQHYFETPSGVRQELSTCGGPDDKIDVLANELEGMRQLLHGYVQNLQRYVDTFESKHAKIQKELESLEVSYKGLYAVVVPACKASLQFECMFADLEGKISMLRHLSRRPPVIIKKQGPRGMKNPPMTAEEQALIKNRREDHLDNAATAAWVTSSKLELEDKQLLAELINPPQPHPEAADPADKSTQRGDQATQPETTNAKKPEAEPIGPRVSLKIEKLTGGLEAMRVALQRTHAKTAQELKYLRTLEAIDSHDVEETWEVHDHIDGLTFSTGKTSELSLRRIEAYDRWANGCLEDIGVKMPTAAAAAAASTPQVSSSATSSPPPPPPADVASSSANGTQSSTSATTLCTGPLAATESSSDATSIPIGPTPQTALSHKNDVYAVCLDLKCEKPLNELTHQDAIDMLKALPLRIHFMPYGPADADASATHSEDEEAKVERILSTVQCPSPGAHDAPAPPPATRERELGGPSIQAALAPVEGKPPSRKRTRASEQGADEHAPTSPQRASAAPPAKKRARN